MDKLTEKEKLVLKPISRTNSAIAGWSPLFGQTPFRTIFKPEGLMQEPVLECCPLLTRKATSFQGLGI